MDEAAVAPAPEVTAEEKVETTETAAPAEVVAEAPAEAVEVAA
jgi:hypothetical protein